jgi:hypothetical protein
VQENSSYYVLAYYPPNPKRDGKFHNIQVRVTRPGLNVRARKGYAAPTGRNATGIAPRLNSPMSVEIQNALQSPLPISGLTMQVFAAPFKGTAPNASVLLGIEMRGKDLRLNGGDKVQISYAAIDAKGKTRGSGTDTVTLNLRPETKAVVEQSGIRTLSRLQIPAGRYQLRVAVNDVGPATIGSVLYDLDVPDFTKAPLTMSGIVMTSPSGSRVPTVRPDEELKQLMPASPVGSRTFPLNEELAVFVEVYDNLPAAAHKVDITTTVTSDDGKVVFKSEDARESSELQGKSGGYGYGARVSLAGLPPGLYVLKIQGKSRVGDGHVVERQVQFRIAEAVAAGDK